MKIVIATPLFPPDIGGAAAYVKELAARLALQHDVTVIMYGRLPEKVAGVSLICIDKRTPLGVRLVRYIFALLRTARQADILYAENGPSVELPAGIITRFLSIPLVVHIGDTPAHHHAARHRLRRLIERFAFRHACSVISAQPAQRPEILPFDPYPAGEIESHETSWRSHIAMLNNIFEHAR